MKKITSDHGSISSERERQSSVFKYRLETLKKSGRFLGVKIDRCACNACSRYAGEVFQFENVPALPVEGCDAESCSCQYLGVANRRNEPDKRSGRERRESIRLEEDRRSGNERRSGLKKWKGFDR